MTKMKASQEKTAAVKDKLQELHRQTLYMKMEFDRGVALGADRECASACSCYPSSVTPAYPYLPPKR